jgi:hypothetical protein
MAPGGKYPAARRHPFRITAPHADSAAKPHAGADDMTTMPTLFCDGILDGSVTSGVARLTLAQTGADGKPAAAGQLIVPLVQLPAVVNGLAGLLKQVETRMREQQSVAGTPAAPPAASAFHFG